VRAALVDAARPPFVVGALAVAVFVVWAAKDAGFAVNTWYPGALFLLALLAVVLAVYPQARRGVPRPTLVAIATENDASRGTTLARRHGTTANRA
jgi:hypothetical protein